MYLSTFTYTPITDESAESELILDAQSGSEAAMMSLIAGYAPLLSTSVKLFKAALPDTDDAEQEVLATFLGHIHSIDVTRNTTCKGFSASMNERLRELIGQKNGLGGIHKRTLSAYTRLIREAKAALPAGAEEAEIVDHVEEAIAKMNDRYEKGSPISFNQFLRVHVAVGPTDNLNENGDYDAETADNDALETEYAVIRECVDRLASDERIIIRFAYGFETPRDLTDAEVREEWSRAVLTPEQFEAGDRITSRATIQRKHKRALDTLRADFLSGLHGRDDDHLGQVA